MIGRSIGWLTALVLRPQESTYLGGILFFFFFFLLRVADFIFNSTKTPYITSRETPFVLTPRWALNGGGSPPPPTSEPARHFTYNERPYALTNSTIQVVLVYLWGCSYCGVEFRARHRVGTWPIWLALSIDLEWIEFITISQREWIGELYPVFSQFCPHVPQVQPQKAYFHI